MRWLIVILALMPGLLRAQGAANLVADTVAIVGENQLIAAGNVEVFYDGTRLSAARITFDRAANRLLIEGPIFIQGADGTILTADRASLDPQLESGMLRGARLVLDQQLQLAAAQIDRADGRISQLRQTAVTSCTVCGTRAPLWEIRADRVVHDEDAQQLYFTNAQFRVRGVPILWLPRVRLPDPTLNRATGFLIPRLRQSDLLGTGLKLPYFITIGDSRDLLLTPYVSRNTTTLEARYRQAFLNGEITVNGAMTDDNLRPQDGRSYLFAEGRFDLRRDYQLAFDIEAVSDPAYLLDYGYADKDRLDSAVSLTRVRAQDVFDASLTYYESLREDEVDSTLPPIVADFTYRRRSVMAGGTLDLTASGDALIRYGSEIGPLGRDLARIGFAADWQRRWVASIGLVTLGQAGIRGDVYQIGDDSDFDDQIIRTTPTLGLTFRYPLVKTTNKARHLLEPLAMIAWSDTYGGTPPNEDGSRPEFDTANLLALSRLPGDDAVETGLRGALGLHWRREGVGGSTTELTFGRVIRDMADPQFTRTSGLQGDLSDWMVAGSWQNREGFKVAARALLTDTLDTNLSEARVAWANSTLALDASYIWQNADTAIGRHDPVSEWSLDGRVQLTPAWGVSFDTRYDVIADTPARAGLGIEWRNECVTVDLSVSRRYTSSTTVEPSTDYGLSVSLSGFSAGRSGAAPITRCTDQ